MTDGAGPLWTAGLEVVRILGDNGHEAFLVGGCVRDRLLGRPVRDIDIATSARPDEVSAVFKRTVPTGLRHGTVTVLHEGRSFEVTTYRTESGYSDARHPDQIAFVHDIHEDLARRDFTINAMAFGLKDVWIDPFDGREDLAACRIRCVGNADERFGEDALRMIRAVRFAAEFGFRINLSVWRGIRTQKRRLPQVAMERIASEWDKMMAGADPDRACDVLARSGLLLCLKERLPENTLHKRWKREPGFCALSDVRDTDVRWISWLIRSGASAAEAARFCRTLRFSGTRETRIATAIAFHKRVSGAGSDRSIFVQAVLEFGRMAAQDWLAVKSGGDRYREWLSGLVVDSVAQLAVRGDELVLRFARVPGPWVAKLLRLLLEETAFGRVRNDKEELLKAASRCIHEVE